MSRVGDALRETGTSLSTVFRNPGLRRVNLAFAGSAIGDWAYATGIVVWAYSVGGVTAVGIWGTVRLILMAVVTPFASIVVDRFSRKMVMVSTDLIRAVLVFLVAGLIAAHAPVLLIFALATITSLVAAPFRPAVAALLPSLVTKPEELTAANGTASTIESLAFFVGPALGGILLTVASVPVVVVFDGLTFLWSAALVSRIVVPKVAAEADAAPLAVEAGAGATSVDAPPEETVAQEAEEVAAGFLSESMAGFRTIWANPDLRLISGVYCAQTVVAGASIVFGVEMATQMTPFGSTGVGYLDSMLGIGAIIGGLVAIGRAAAKKLATDFGWGVVFWAVPLLLAAAWPHAGAAFAAVFIIGFANPIVDVNASTILQRLADDSVMGRVFGALETGLIAAMAFGSIVFPILNQWLGLRWALAILAVGVTATVVPAFGRLRRLDATLGEPEGLPVLRSLPLFSPLDAKSLEDIARKLGRTEVPAGTPIITEGDTGDRFYIVESGRTTATHHGQVLSTQGPGDPFGEIALLRDVPRTATVTADEDTVLFFLERDDFLAAVSGDNEVANRADDLVSRRIPTY
jgi:MFS family permease